MFSRYMFLRPPVLGIICVLAICVCGIMPFSGCTEAQQEKPTSQRIIIYDDGVYRIELTGSESIDDGQESDCMLLTLCFANNSLEDIALSSVLGVKVSTADGQPCELIPVTKGSSRQTLDSLVPSGDSREGCIMFKMPVEATCFTVDMAVDFLNDEWIRFDITL